MVVASGILFVPAVFTQQADKPEKPPQSQAPNSVEVSAPLSVDSTNVEPVKTVKAAYPEDARRRHMQGEVWVKVLITETGDVEKAEVVSGDRIFVDSALAAAKKWKFKPFIKDGHPVRVFTKIAFDFAFRDKVAEISPDEGKTLQVQPSVVAGMLVHRVTPVYADTAKRYGIQGTVILSARIGKDGLVKELKAISGPPVLIPAAIGAVEQWRYKPYLSNGEPIDIATTITVKFDLIRR